MCQTGLYEHWYKANVNTGSDTENYYVGHNAYIKTVVVRCAI
jgi:hypothetical protein